MAVEESHHCPVCSGTGWKTIDQEGVRSVLRCDCFRRDKTERLFRNALVPQRYVACSFDNFNAITDRLKIAKTVALKFVDEYPLVDCGLLIIGPCGVGKTHLAVAILRELISKHDALGIFYDFRDLLKKIQNSYNAVSQTSEMEILEPVLDCEVLVLDDLGAERPTEWVRDTFAYILNSRYNRKLTTLITTNFSDERSDARVLPDGNRVVREETLEERIGTRIRSRLYEMCKVISVEGSDDFRIKVKQAQYRF